MKLAIRLALRDLRGGLSSLGLLWLCLAVAIAGLASVTSLASAIDRASADNGRAMLGGDLLLSISSREAGAEERAAIDVLGGTTKSITTRSMLVGPDGRSQLVELSGVDRSWRLAGEVDWGAGGLRPSGAEAGVGREVAERLELRLGQQVRLGNAAYRIVSIIQKMPGQS